jgi:hypothetical protein
MTLSSLVVIANLISPKAAVAGVHLFFALRALPGLGNWPAVTSPFMWVILFAGCRQPNPAKGGVELQNSGDRVLRN